MVGSDVYNAQLEQQSQQPEGVPVVLNSSLFGCGPAPVELQGPARPDIASRISWGLLRLLEELYMGRKEEKHRIRPVKKEDGETEIEVQKVRLGRSPGGNGMGAGDIMDTGMGIGQCNFSSVAGRREDVGKKTQFPRHPYTTLLLLGTPYNGPRREDADADAVRGARPSRTLNSSDHLVMRLSSPRAASAA
ncbi:hypothetical protein TruAng_002457 [Truncatella angustata]|nr:hypothetical protein TruAng_002457 [Truncatella angustata]